MSCHEKKEVDKSKSIKNGCVLIGNNIGEEG